LSRSRNGWTPSKGDETMKRYVGAVLVGILLILALGCGGEKYHPRMKDPKQQEKDGKEMMKDAEK